MDKVISVILTAVALACLGFGAILGAQLLGDDDGKYRSDMPIEVTVVIDDGDSIETYTFQTRRANAYGALIEASSPEIGDFEVVATWYTSFDAHFIETIGDKSNGQDNHYWLYYVNGESGNVGADRYRLEDGDVVEWRFEESIY